MLTNARLGLLTQLMQVELMRVRDPNAEFDSTVQEDRTQLVADAQHAWEFAKIAMDAAPEDVKLAISQAEVADGNLEQLLRDMRNSGN